MRSCADAQMSWFVQFFFYSFKGRLITFFKFLVLEIKLLDFVIQHSYNCKVLYVLDHF